MSITGKALTSFGLLVSLVGLGAESPVTALKIEVHLYNYSGVTAEELARAEQETARIYGRLGVQMEWRNCPRTAKELAQNTTCDLPAAPTRFTVRLLSNEMANRFPVGGDIYGFALLPVNAGFGVVVNIFADRARDIGADEETHGAILGHLIAHELGHLLLSEAGHSAGAGMMHVPWQTKELKQIKRGVMLFLPGQTERIQAQVLARTISRGEPTAPKHPTAGTLGAVESSPKITVFVYNYAAVAPDVLALNEAEGSRIYQQAGIEIQWLECPYQGF